MPLTSFKKVSLSLSILSLSFLMSGCGGNNPMAQPPINPAVQTMAFQSSAALDGSNGTNSNATVNIWLAKTDGSAATPLTRLTGNGAGAFEPIWSPDGRKIAFVSARALDGSDAAIAAANVWIMNADGTGPLLSLALRRVESRFGIWPGRPMAGKWRLRRLPLLTAATL